MKRFLVPLLSVSLLLALSTSCSKEEEVEDEINRNGNSSGGSTQGPGLNSTSSVELSAGESTAKSAALRHAGVSETAVQGMTVTYNENTGVGHYDVSFWVDTVEYYFAVLASDSTIISFATTFHDSGYVPPALTEEGSDVEFAPELGNISGEDAQIIVLNHSSQKLEDISNYTIVQGTSGNFDIYNISFSTESILYHYSLMAGTGQVLLSSATPIIDMSPLELPEAFIPETTTPEEFVPEEFVPEVEAPAPEPAPELEFPTAPEITEPEVTPEPEPEEFATSAPTLG